MDEKGGDGWIVKIENKDVMLFPSSFSLQYQ